MGTRLPAPVARLCIAAVLAPAFAVLSGCAAPAPADHHPVAVIGGMSGHQVGGGSGLDLATVGGVVAGAAIGSQGGQSSQRGPVTQDVQRCSPSGGRDEVDYWDVTYE